MSLGPTIVRFSFPQIIDVSDGPVTVPFTVEGAFGDAHLGIVDISFATDQASFAELLANPTDGAYSGRPQLSVTGMLRFDPATPAGTYKLQSLGIHDSDWNGTNYTAAQMAAMGWSTEYTIVDSKAPAAPVETLQGAEGDVFHTSQPVLAGTAAPGSTVAVSAWHLNADSTGGAIDEIKLGTAVADGSGHWTLTTPVLDDGEYTRVRATATSEGHTSAYSTALAFHVAAHALAPPQVQLRLDTNGYSDSATPYVSGMTKGGSTVSIMDGDSLAGTTVADAAGWFGLVTAPLPAGSHHLTVVANDAVTHETASTPLVVSVPDAPAPGIRLEIASFANETTVGLGQAALQRMLDKVSGILSAAIDGSENIPVRVHVMDMTVTSYAAAAASAPLATIDPVSGMPVIPYMDLYLAKYFAEGLVAHPDVTRTDLSVLTHEVLHALGFLSGVDPVTHQHPAVDYKFGELTDFIGGTPYFTGHYATAIHGGPVELANMAHLGIRDDIMYPGQPDSFSDVTFFGSANPTAPLTAVDLGILKDLGYTIKDAFVSADGHTFVAGSGRPGHDRVTGTAGLDTLFVDGPSGSYAVAHTATGFSLADQAGRGGTHQLSAIERIEFADGMVALDIGAGEVGGAVYRLYQAAFDRKPDAAGLGYWIDRLDHGASARSMADEFVASSEFAGLYGASQSDRAFIELVYRNVLHRAPDQAGLDYWHKVMQSGPGRAELLIEFSESHENIVAVGSAIGDGFAFTPYPA